MDYKKMKRKHAQLLLNLLLLIATLLTLYGAFKIHWIVGGIATCIYFAVIIKQHYEN
jgi:uncharacterized protein (UPF0333 family)